MILRLTLRFLALFLVVLLALDAIAVWLYDRMYAGLIGPALGTPEGAAGMHAALARVIETVIVGNIPLVIIVGVASFMLASSAVAPLLAARERERQFSADAAHELRSPLATITAVVQAERGHARNSSSAAFDTIERSALAASGLVGDLLTLARDPRPALLQREPVDLAYIATECGREIAAIASVRGLTLHVETRSAVVNGDARRLKELVRNLADNALKHARTMVRISTTVRQGCAVCSVSNDGEPIDASLHERIFERFYRADQSGEGTGLGLPIVRWIARAHDGSIALRSDDTETTFSLMLPGVK